MSFSDQVPICGLKYGLRSFQVLEIFCMFSVEVTMLSGDILVDNIGFEKLRHLLKHF